MMDKIFMASLDAQHEQAQALADASDLLEVERLDSQRFLARFHSKALICEGDGEVREVNGFVVGYWFRESYLRFVEPLEVITWISPRSVFHPNVRTPACCVGHISPGTPLIDLLYRTYEVVSCQNVMPSEKESLNPAACQWARNNQNRFPLDDRPLKRRSRDVRREALGLPRSLELPR